MTHIGSETENYVSETSFISTQYESLIETDAIWQHPDEMYIV